MTIDIQGLHFEQTCSVCPEQYNVYDSNMNLVGYIRLRFGCMTCEYPDVGGKLIYESSIGNGWTGCFEDDDQRMFNLNACAEAIIKEMENT